MKIAIIGSRGYPYVYSGYETFVSELSTRLALKGHEVFVYCHKGLFKTRPPVVKGVNLFYLPSIEKKVLSQFSHSLLATFHVIFQDMDVLFYVNSANGPFGLITKILHKHTAINVDGLEWLRPKWKGLGAKYFRTASCLATKFFDVLINDSEEMAKIYKTEFNASSVVIAYGANQEYNAKPELIEFFGLSPGSYYLVVARLIPDNNGNIIVQGFEKAKTDKKLVIVGDVPYRDEYAEKIRSTKDPRIIFAGYVQDQDMLRELYCNAYAYIHGHGFGGTNPSLLQALGSGSCVLALDTVFNREVLAGNEYGVYFEKDPESLAVALNLLDMDPGLVSLKKEKARDRIKENYTWEKITDQYEQLFLQMVQNKFITRIQN